MNLKVVDIQFDLLQSPRGFHVKSAITAAELRAPVVRNETYFVVPWLLLFHLHRSECSHAP